MTEDGGWMEDGGWRMEEKHQIHLLALLDGSKNNFFTKQKEDVGCRIKDGQR